MSDAPETRLTDPRPNPGALLVPVASPSEVLAAQEQVRALVQQTLKKDRDYGIIPGTKKPTLLKPGAERINAAFGVAVRYKIVASEIDHDRPVAWTKRKAQYKSGKFVGYEEISGNSVGLYRYVVDCELIQRAPGVIIGQGIGSCSTMESKYVDRPREVENTILKIAEKRGLIAATLNAYGLSDQFTQDMEDAEPLPSGNEGVDDAPASDTLARPTCPKCSGEMWDNRKDKKNPRAPDYKCKDKTCDGAFWPGQWPPKEAPATYVDHSDETIEAWEQIARLCDARGIDYDTEADKIATAAGVPSWENVTPAVVNEQVKRIAALPEAKKTTKRTPAPAPTGEMTPEEKAEAEQREREGA